jgi:hypothetical protein
MMADDGGASGSVAGVNTDASINGLPAGSTGVSATAYTNSFAQSLTGGTTTQYTLDAASNSLFIQNPPNTGTETSQIAVTLGGNPLDFSDVNGLDIPASVRVSTSNAAATGEGWFVGFAIIAVSDPAITIAPDGRTPTSRRPMSAASFSS